jgi:hypothetical protein
MGYRWIGPRKRKALVKATSLVSEIVGADPAVFRMFGVMPQDFQAFERAISGRVVLPGMPEYDSDRVSNPLYQEFPKVIVYCATFSDVRFCLEAAVKYNWWITTRSGGHSTAGFSVNSGIVIDLSSISYITVDPYSSVATVGAGARFENLNSTLDMYHLHVPGGGCPDVGIAGYMQGGGYGFTSRTYGMHCDNVLEITMMTWEGRIVIANETRNADLFWAIRGGTGNQFGILLEVKYRLHKWDSGWGFALVWDQKNAAAALAEMQRTYMKTGVDDKLGFMAAVGTFQGQTVAMMFGIYVGSRDQGMRAIQSLLAVGNPDFKVDLVSEKYSVLDAAVMSFLPGPGDPGTFEIKSSQYIAKLMDEACWQEVVDYFEGHSDLDHPYNIGFIEAYGGAINRISITSNAFIHRDAYMQFDVDSFWNPRWGPNSTEANARTYLTGATNILRQHWNGHEYQNYPQRNDPNYRWEYWGEIFNSLLYVRQKYDPLGVFHYEQSISPYPQGAAVTRSAEPSKFDDATIIYAL